MQQFTNLKEIEKAVNQYGKIAVSENGKNNVAVMSMDEYKKKLDKDIEEKILKSEEDYNNGRVRKAENVFKEWKISENEKNYI